MTAGETFSGPEMTAYVNARLLDPATGRDETGILLTKGREIADIGPSVAVPEGARRIDCLGACLAPGLIDMRVQVGEPGSEHKGTFQTEGLAAAAGGVTTIVCLPNTDPPIDDVAMVEFVARRGAESGVVNVRSYAHLTRAGAGAELTEIGLLAEVGALALTDGTRCVADAAVMRRALAYATGFDVLVMQHAEEPSLTNGGDMNAGEIATRLGLRGMPPAAEAMMIERDLHLVRMTGARYHVGHVSTALAVGVIRAAKAEGLQVTCDTAPPYLALNELAVSDYRTFAKLSPPLRSEADRRAIVEGVVDGTIDAIASDHTPQDEDDKRLPFSQAEFGAVGLETLLAVSLGLVHDGDLDLNTLFARLSLAPARILRLPGGTLQPGAPADLCLFDPDRAWRVKADRLMAKSKNTPFDKKPLQGRVLRTVVGGKTVFEIGA
ncbi:MAG: dihydroorotase [Alphaproteobacteria bacterium]